MKVLVVLTAVLAVAVAKPGYLGAAGLLGLAGIPAPVAVIPPGGPANIVIGPGGVPLDTPAVAAARGAHLVAVAQTRARDAVVNAAPAALGLAPSIAALGVAPSVAGLGIHGLAAPSIAALGVHGLAAPSIAALAPGLAGVPGALAHLQAKAALLG